MADIELVIKIPEWEYKSICEGVESAKRCGVVGVYPTIHEAIYNGTPLPKGHGRLIDADDIAIIDEQFYIPSDYYVAESAINDAPTIIERSEINVQ